MEGDLARAVLLFRKVLESDMAAREEDEGQKSPLLKDIRAFCKSIDPRK